MNLEMSKGEAQLMLYTLINSSSLALNMLDREAMRVALKHLQDIPDDVEKFCCQVKIPMYSGFDNNEDLARLQMKNCVGDFVRDKMALRRMEDDYEMRCEVYRSDIWIGFGKENKDGTELSRQEGCKGDTE